LIEFFRFAHSDAKAHLAAAIGYRAQQGGLSDPRLAGEKYEAALS
jgi:hypothetical protein